MKDNNSKIKNNTRLQRSTVKVATGYKDNLKRLSIDTKKSISVLTEEALRKVYKFESLEA